GNGEMEHLPAFLGILERRRSYQHAALGRAAAEGLSRTDAEATLLPLGRTARFHPVIGTGRNQHGLVGGDALQQLSPGPAIAVIADRGGNEMLMHGERQRRRRAVMGEAAQEGAHLAVACAAAAELDGNEGGEDLVLLQRAIVSRDEAVFRVAL